MTVGEGPTAEKTRTRYFRGMGGDLDGVTDRRQFAGMARTVTRYDGDTPVERTTNTPWRSETGENARGVKSFLSANRVTETTTFDAAGDEVHTTRVTTTHDGDTGLVLRVHDAGDVSISGDDTCTTYTYNQNVSRHLLNRVSRELMRASSSCTQTNGSGRLLTDERTFYDGATSLTAAPSAGLATRTDVHGLDEVLTTRTGYDTYGRVTGQWDEDGNKTTTAYSPATGAATRVTVTGADSAHVMAIDLDPARGVATKVTDVAGGVTTAEYDGLGRLTDVWFADRDTSASPSLRHEYTIRSQVAAIVTRTLNAAGDGYHAEATIFDGLGRQVQSQAESKSVRHPGAVVSDTRYDSANRVVTESGPWFTTNEVDDRFYDVGASPYPSQTDFEYDGAGRVVREALLETESELWATETEHDGARVSVTPPDGGTPTTTMSDARGNVVALTQHTGADTHGDLTTSYVWDVAGNLTQVTDPEDNAWEFVYDILGREVFEDDPDAGATTTSYTATGQIDEVTDARGVTVRHSYDVLGRPTGLSEVTGSGVTPLSSRVWDTVATGQVSYTVRHDERLGDITSGVSEYDVMGRPVTEYVQLPDHGDLKDLAGERFEASVSYAADGQVASRSVDGVGGSAG